MEQLLWFDMEMTGLDVNQDLPLEVACVATGPDFEILGEGHWVVHQTDDILMNMNEWCLKHHGASGLIQDVRTLGVPTPKVDELLCQWTSQFWKSPSPIVLAGNSIHQDRLFAFKYFPQFAHKLHYRMLDVSSFKIFFETHLHKKFEKKNPHRAANDVLDSLQEFLFYSKYIKVN